MSSNPYDRPSDPAKRNSAALTDGPDRAAARAMLKGTGFTVTTHRTRARGRKGPRRTIWTAQRRGT